MHDKMMKMLMSKKKQGKTLSDSDKKAKLSALEGMRSLAHDAMSSKLKNLKKVTVASDSKPGLKAGLHKAEDLLDQSSDGESEKSAYAQGGSVDELPDHKNPPKDLGPKGRKVGQLPEEFDRDEDHVSSEHDYDNSPRHFNEGGEMEEESPEHEASESPEFEAGEQEESLEKILSDSPNDPDQLDELIKKLEEKKRSLAK